MSKHDETLKRVLEIATRLSEPTALGDEPTAITPLKAEFGQKFGLKERQLERLIADARLLKAWAAKHIDAIKQAATTDVWATVAEKTTPGIQAMLDKLLAIANAEYVTEKTISTHDGFKTIKVTPTIKEELLAMDKILEYKQLFISIMEHYPSVFIEMTKKLVQFNKQTMLKPNATEGSN